MLYMICQNSQNSFKKKSDCNKTWKCWTVNMLSDEDDPCEFSPIDLEMTKCLALLST